MVRQYTGKSPFRTPGCRFKARLWLVDAEPTAEYWSDELDPMDGKRIGNAEWAQDSCTFMNFWEELGLDPEKNYQVLVKGEIYGSYDYQGEYDEQIQLEIIESAEIPEEYLQRFRWELTTDSDGQED